MRILIDLQAYQSGSRERGIGRYALEMTKALLVGPGRHEYRVIVNGAMPQSIQELQSALAHILSRDSFLTFFPTGRTSAADKENAWRLRASQIARKYTIDCADADVVFIPSFFEGLSDEVVMSLEPSAPTTLVALHDLIPYTHPHQHPTDPPTRRAYLQQVQSLRSADAILAVSSFVSDQARHLLGFSSDRVFVTREGYSDCFGIRRESGREVDAFLRSLGITKPFVMTVGLLEYRKNLEGLIAGFGAMPAGLRQNYQLVVVGRMDGYARNKLATACLRAGLAPSSLVLCGAISDEHLARLYNHCHLFAFPSLNEGFGLPVLEAMACGAAVVSSNSTSLPELVRTPTARFCPSDPGDIARVMTRFLSNDAEREALRVAGHKHAQEYSWSRSAECAEEAFNAALDRKRTGAISLSATSKEGAKRPTLAILASFRPGTTRGACYLLTVIPMLSIYYRISLYTLDDLPSDELLSANFEMAHVDQFINEAFRYDRVLLNVAGTSGSFLPVALPDLPFVTLTHAHLEADANIPEAPGAVWRAYGYPGLIRCANSHWRNVGLLLTQDQALEPLFPEAIHSADISTAVIDVAKLLPLPLSFGASGAAFSRRIRTGGRADGRLLLLSGADAKPAIASFLRADSGDRTLAVWQSDSVSGPLAPDGFGGRVCTIDGRLDDCYARLLEECVGILLYGSFDDLFVAAVRLDASFSGIALEVVSASAPEAFLEQAFSKLLQQENRETGWAAAPQGPDVRSSAWEVATQISREIEAFYSDPRFSALPAALAAIPHEVAGVTPSPHDLQAMAMSFEATVEHARARRILIDVTTLAAPGPRGICVGTVRRFLLFAIGDRKRRVELIFSDGVSFRFAHGFVAALLGLRTGFDIDGEVITRRDDVVLLLDEFAYEQTHRSAVERLCCDSARAVTLSLSTMCLSNGTVAEHLVQSAIDALLLDAESTLETPAKTLAASLPDGLPGIDWGEQRLVVEGHASGTYSLAIINRSVAHALERRFPGRVRFDAFETDQIHDANALNLLGDALVAELFGRSSNAHADEIVISQHYPPLEKRHANRLRIALFAWEETHVPAALIATLSTHFDGVIATARSVSKALMDSGLRIPTLAIGQPSAAAHFSELWQSRRSFAGARTFLHVSSCFPRKGLDILLRAWARAFSADTGHRLVIKTFPNPHNTAESQISALKAAHPSMATVELIDEELDQVSIKALYARADVMVLPSRGEGYNLPALEAALAGIPIIVTDYGGQRDFCGPDEARLLRYLFAPSQSHVRESASLWVEPDEDDLVQALIELSRTGDDAVEARRLRARSAGLAAVNPDLWNIRLQHFIDALQQVPFKLKSLAWITTWSVPCGIATYSKSLIAARPEADRSKLTILCDTRTEAENESSGGRPRIVPCWDLGWNADKLTGLKQIMGFMQTDGIVIQHQDGLLSWRDLASLVSLAFERGIVTVIVLHNTQLLLSLEHRELQDVLHGLKQSDRLLVHNLRDLNALTILGLADRSTLFPHGADNTAIPPVIRPLSPQLDSPVVGCHGFLFSHKGVDKLIAACAKLRASWPGLRLKLVNSIFPSDGSRDYYEKCKQVAAASGIDDATEWMTDFSGDEAVREALQSCDLIVLPYAESTDSASGAARTAMSSKVPVMLTDVRIFEEFSGTCEGVSVNDPDVLAEAMDRLLRDLEARRAAQARLCEWLDRHEWKGTADKLWSLMRALRWQKDQTQWNN